MRLEAGLFPEQPPGKILTREAGLIAGDEDLETLGQGREVLLDQKGGCEPQEERRQRESFGPVRRIGS